MRKNPKILLIYPPNQLASIEQPRPDGSLGLLYLAGALERAGFEADILDASVGAETDNLDDTFYRAVRQPNGLTRIGMSQERLRTFIADGKYDIIGINSNFTPQTRMALEVAVTAKDVNPDILVVSGGTNAKNLPGRFFESGAVDIICLTEGEKIFVKIVEAWVAGLGYGRVSGITYQAEKRRVTNPVAPCDTHMNLDELPFPTWEKLPFRHYDRIVSSRSGVEFAPKVRYAPIMTSRGCPFRCAYCHISKEKEDPLGSGNIGAYRIKSVARVLEEVRRLRDLGVYKLFFEDDSLLANKSRVKTIFENVLGMGLRIAAINGVNLVHFQRRGKNGKLEIDAQYLELLRDAGFDEISFPVESGSQRILDKYATAKLNLSTLDVVELVRIATRLGIKCPINMMIGFPDETEEEILQSVELGKRLVDAGAAYCSPFIPIPFPGSQLYDMAIAEGYLDRDFDPDSMNFVNAVMYNTTVPPERIVELRDRAWREMNPKEYVEERIRARAENILK